MYPAPKGWTPEKQRRKDRAYGIFWMCMTGLGLIIMVAGILKGW